MSDYKVRVKGGGKKTKTITKAAQWNRNGDHPKDGKGKVTSGENKGELLEGKVVKNHNKPSKAKAECYTCGGLMGDHGWIDQGSKGLVVCPGDYVITESVGIYSVMKPGVFKRAFDVAE